MGGREWKDATGELRRENACMEGVHRARRGFLRHPTHTMQIQSVLRRLYPQPGFAFGSITPVQRHGRLVGLDVAIHARKGAKAVCSRCMKRRPLYDQLACAAS
jgi:hypothetical protein